MRRVRWTAAVVVTAVLGGWAGTAAAQPVTEPIDLEGSPAEACTAVFGAGAFGGFLPKGNVAAGEPVSVDLSWNKALFPVETVDMVGCVSVDGAIADGMAAVERSVENDGEHRRSFIVDRDVRLGAKVCERTAVIGPEGDAGPVVRRLGANCFTVASASQAGGPTPAAEAPAPPAPSKEEKPAAKEEVAAPAPKPAAGPMVPGEPAVAGATENREPAAAPAPAEPAPASAAPAELGRTGSPARSLTVLAGLLLLLGGVAVAFGATPTPAAVRAERRPR